MWILIIIGLSGGILQIPGFTTERECMTARFEAQIFGASKAVCIYKRG